MPTVPLREAGGRILATEEVPFWPRESTATRVRTSLFIPNYLGFDLDAGRRRLLVLEEPTLPETAVPPELVDAARVDGAGEVRIFFTIVFRLIAPGFVTVLLFAFVGAWNNYFLPLLVLLVEQNYQKILQLDFLATLDE